MKSLKAVSTIFCLIVCTSISFGTQNDNPKLKCSLDFMNKVVLSGKVSAFNLAGVYLHRKGVNLETVESNKSGVADERWRKVATSLGRFFYMVDIYEDDFLGDPGWVTLEPGDFLVYSVDWEPHGAVAVVHSVDSQKMTADISMYMEQDKSFKRMKFELSLDPPSAELRFIRPGLLGLSPNHNSFCKLTEGLTARS